MKDKHNEHRTISEIKRMVSDIKALYEAADGALDGLIEVGGCPAYDAKGNPSGFYFSISPTLNYLDELEEKGFSGCCLKSARGYLRVFKTIEPIADICKELGFQRCILWLE